MTPDPIDTSSLQRAIDAACEEMDRLRAINADLLAALGAAEDWLRITLSPFDPDCERVLHTVQAAIAKAEGR